MVLTISKKDQRNALLTAGYTNVAYSGKRRGWFAQADAAVDKDGKDKVEFIPNGWKFFRLLAITGGGSFGKDTKAKVFYKPQELQQLGWPPTPSQLVALRGAIL